MARRERYAVGDQSFPSLREGGYVYVDKTQYIEKILEKGQYFFLGRPRRFGKSLFLSTLKCFFQGRRELFKGLYADTMDWDWQPRPVLYIDFNLGSYRGENKDLVSLLENLLSKWEEEYGIEHVGKSHGVRFGNVIEAAYKKTGKKVVVLVDEYDKPLVNNLNDPEEFEKYRNILYGFYSNFKSSADYLQLVFLTGVSRFGKLSIFSGLNNIKDISFDSNFSGICGITSSEVDSHLTQGIQKLADAEEMELEETRKELKKYYDGYHFCRTSEDIYNPFSLLWALDASDIGNYWIQSGDATILCEQLKNFNIDLKEMFNCQCSQDELMGIIPGSSRPLALLYQTGYLTIKDFDKEMRLYTLGIPNEEVKRGFLNRLLPYYTTLHSEQSAFVVSEFVREFREGKVEGFMKRLQSLFSKTTYRLKLENENNFQNALYILMMLVGLYVEAELCTSDGRIDLFVATPKYYYIIELKVDSTPEDALRQIEEKDYELPFAIDGRKIIKIGANFSTEDRTLTGWESV